MAEAPIANAGAMNACGVVNLEVMRVIKLVSHTQVGHPVVQVAVIIVVTAIGELGIEAAILIAHSGSG